MAKTTITIDETLKKGADWYNITYMGKPLGINVKSNPKTIEAINSGAITVDINLSPSKDGTKYYGFDVNEDKPKGGSKFNPEFEERKQKMIIAQSSMSTASQYFQQRQPSSSEDMFSLAEKIYNWVIEKSK